MSDRIEFQNETEDDLRVGITGRKARIRSMTEDSEASDTVVCDRQDCDEEAAYRVTNGVFVESRCDDHATHDLPNTEVIGYV